MTDRAQPGYNIVEAQYLSNYIIPKDKIGFIQFMRQLRKKQLNKKSEYLVKGLDKILGEIEDIETIAKVVREELANAREWIPRGIVLLFPVQGELRGRVNEPILHLDNKINCDLKQFFGNRIERKGVARCFASFEIER